MPLRKLKNALALYDKDAALPLRWFAEKSWVQALETADILLFLGDAAWRAALATSEPAMQCISECVVYWRVPMVAKELLLEPRLKERVFDVWFQDRSWVQSLSVTEAVEFFHDPDLRAALAASEPCMTMFFLIFILTFG